MDAWLGTHLQRRAAAELVLLPSDDRLAWCVPGDPHQIVITAGLAEHLSAGQLAAVVRHEAAHLAARHHQLLELGSVSSSAFWWFAPARRSAATLVLATERCADEIAGDTPEGRAALAQALRLLIGHAIAPGTAAISPAGTLAERLAALENSPAPHPRARATLVSSAAVAALGFMAAEIWLAEGGFLALLAGRCPIYPA